jgi:hypothetical protein
MFLGVTRSAERHASGYLGVDLFNVGESIDKITDATVMTIIIGMMPNNVPSPFLMLRIFLFNVAALLDSTVRAGKFGVSFCNVLLEGASERGRMILP